MLKLEKILACPNCKKEIGSLHTKECSLSGRKFRKRDGVWHFTSYDPPSHSMIQYEKMHAIPWGRLSDGSYEVLASMARGNKSLDIACGEGWIEKLAPDTVGLDFSLSALKKAKQNGAKNLVWASAEKLPFVDGAFDISICAGSLENIESPQKALNEMARVSKIQVLTIHRQFPLPGANIIRKIILKLSNTFDQPVEKPFSKKEIKKMFMKAKLRIVFDGFWTYPFNLEMFVSKVPKFLKIPSCFFIISIGQE